MTTATATRLQLPLSCGERRYIPRWFSLCCSYNSRSPAESDVNKLLLPANDLATTPALLRRATCGLWYRCERVCATTPALLRRATALQKQERGIRRATTHALLRRATNMQVPYRVNIRLQLTLSCGERLCLIYFYGGLAHATTPALLRRATLMRRHLEGIDLAATHALLRRATPKWQL